MNIAPVEVPGYIIPYIIRECAGVHLEQQGDFFADIRIEPNSVFGMFLTRTIRPDYKVKFYQIRIFTRKVGLQRAFSSDILEYKNNAEFQIDLSFTDLDNFYRFLDSIFNASFYFFLQGFCDGNTQDREKIKNGINKFIDRYDLLEYGFNENQLRIMYYRYRTAGGGVSFINNKSRYFSGRF